MKKKPATFVGESKRFYWRGQEWTLARMDDEAEADKVLGKRTLACIMRDSAFVGYRGSMPKESAIMAILHEAGHEMFPEWKSEPTFTSSAEVGIFERDVKTLLESMGVDLSPMVKFVKKS